MNQSTHYEINIAMSLKYFAFLTLLALTNISDALAEPPDSKSAAYMWSPEMQNRLYALGLYLDKHALGKLEACNGKAWLEPISVAVLQPLAFTAEGTHPSKGIWTIRYRFDRCGESIIYNALFKANDQKQPIVFNMPPGTTKTSPRLQQDMNPSLLMVASMHNGDIKGCKLAAVTDTKVTVEPTSVKVGNETLEGVWEEYWTVRTCSVTFNMEYCFIPEMKGGTSWIQSKCEPAKIATARSLSGKQ